MAGVWIGLLVVVWYRICGAHGAMLNMRECGDLASAQNLTRSSYHWNRRNSTSKSVFDAFVKRHVEKVVQTQHICKDKKTRAQLSSFVVQQDAEQICGCSLDGEPCTIVDYKEAETSRWQSALQGQRIWFVGDSVMSGQARAFLSWLEVLCNDKVHVFGQFNFSGKVISALQGQRKGNFRARCASPWAEVIYVRINKVLPAWAEMQKHTSALWACDKSTNSTGFVCQASQAAANASDVDQPSLLVLGNFIWHAMGERKTLTRFTDGSLIQSLEERLTEWQGLAKARGPVFHIVLRGPHPLNFDYKDAQQWNIGHFPDNNANYETLLQTLRGDMKRLARKWNWWYLDAYRLTNEYLGIIQVSSNQTGRSYPNLSMLYADHFHPCAPFLYVVWNNFIYCVLRSTSSPATVKSKLAADRECQ